MKHFFITLFFSIPAIAAEPVTYPEAVHIVGERFWIDSLEVSDECAKAFELEELKGFETSSPEQAFEDAAFSTDQK